MPKTKFQEVIFTIMMVFVMVYENPFHLVLAISFISVAFMCPLMSLAATILFKHAGNQFIAVWLQTCAFNFPMALCWQIFYAGPLVRFLFRLIFLEKQKQ